MVLRISLENRWTGKYSAFTRPYEKLLIPTDLAIVHITLLVVVCEREAGAGAADDSGILPLILVSGFHNLFGGQTGGAADDSGILFSSPLPEFDVSSNATVRPPPPRILKYTR